MKNSTKILVADDDPVIVAATRRLLESAGYETLSAQDGQEALEVTRAQHPDLILLDVSMPRMDGFEVCRQIKTDPALAGTFIIIISSTKTDSDSHANGLNLGADGYISRPIANRELLARVQAMLRIQEAEKALRLSEQRFRALFERHKAIILLIDPESGAIVDASPAAAEYYGYSHAELCAMSIEAINQLPAEEVAAERMRAKREERNYFIFPHRLANGQIRTVEVYSSPIEVQGQELLFSIIHDITARKRAEEALRISEGRYRMAQAMGHVGNWEYNLQTNEFWGSDEAKHIYGFDLEQPNFTTDEVENCIPERERVHQALVDLIEADKPYNLEFEIHPKNSLKPRIIFSVAELKRDEYGNPLLVMGVIQDITERKQAEEALRNSETRLRTLVQTIPDLIWLKDVDGEYLSCNKMFERFFGASQADIVGKTDYDFVDRELADSFRKHDRRAMAAGKPTSNEELITFADDGYRAFLETIKTPMYDDRGTLTGVLGIGRDITARKQAEETLRLRESYLTAILENQPGLVWLKDLDSRFLAVNRAFAISCGKASPAELTGKTDLDIWPRGLAEKYRADDARIIESKTSASVEEPIFDRGKTSWFETFKTPVMDDKGNVIGTTGFSRDITERKQAENALRESEERYRQLHESMRDCFSQVKMSGEIVAVNPAYLDMLGYSKEELLKLHYSDITPQRWHEFEQEIVNTQVLAFGYSDVYEKEYIKKDGTVFPVELRTFLLRDAKGQPSGMWAIVRDITERKRTEEGIRQLNAELEQRVIERTRELREAQEQLVRQEKLAVLGQLAGGVGHELRNPLGIINNAIYYLRMIQPDADEKVKEYLGIIETETHTADKIISDLLDFSRIKSVDVEPVTASKLAKDTLERFPPPENVHVTLNLPENLPSVYVDPRQMTQVLGNLVLNACQSMVSPGFRQAQSTRSTTGVPKGGKLTLSARKKGKMVAIAVADTGVGITPENMKKLFEPLFTTKPKGIGLGLAVSKKLVEANGGRIEVESEPGKGSTFTIYLPVSKGLE